MSADTARVLRDAASHLEVNGWCQGALHLGQSSCLLGAVSRAVGIQDEATYIGDDGTYKLGNVIGFLQGVIEANPVIWNDVPGRTQAEVVKVLLTAADLADIAEAD